MSNKGKLKITVYMAEDTFLAMKNEGDRLERNVSWMVEQSWKIARTRVRNFQGVDDYSEDNG